MAEHKEICEWQHSRVNWLEIYLKITSTAPYYSALKENSTAQNAPYYSALKANSTAQNAKKWCYTL